MKRGLSASTYIKANKKRVSVLVITIALFATMLYLVHYMLDPTYTTFKKLAFDQIERQQFIRMNYDSQYDNLDEFLAEGVELLEKQTNVIDAFPVRHMSIPVTSLIGIYNTDVTLTSKEKVNVLMGYFDGTLIEGRMPENPGEIILDKKLCLNNNLKLNDKFNMEYTVVGIVESNYYLATGISNRPNNSISILSKGKGVDYSTIARGLEVDTVVYDSVKSAKEYEENVVKPMASSKSVITLGSLFVLSICLVIVINMYYRDRHEEWCLYQSIGFSSQNIFFVTFREMLIIFSLGIFISIFIIGIGIAVINIIIIKPQGLLAREFLPETISSILAALTFILGVCQIPLFYAMNKIRTIDILEEEE